MNKKKKILAIVLVFVVLLLGGASIYVATQLSTKQAVAPNAPESKPAASAVVADCSSYNSQNCPPQLCRLNCGVCIPKGAMTPDVCPTGSEQVWVGSAACTTTATATDVVIENMLTLSKMGFNNEATNSAGTYYMKTNNKKSLDGHNTVAKGETFIYQINVSNTRSTKYNSVILSDVLIGNNLEKLTFKDSQSVCTFVEATRTVTCDLGSIEVGKSKTAAFRVTAAEDITDGLEIKNTVSVAYDGMSKTADYNLTVKNPAVAERVILDGKKTAFKNESTNTAGKYTLTSEMETVSKNQTYVYSIVLTNNSANTANGVVIKDSLKDVTSLTFIDTASSCTWSATNKELSCNTTIKPDETKTFNFRVKASETVINGDVIPNVAKVTLTNGDGFELKKDLTVSTIVGCNNACTTDEECSNGLSCDSSTKKCRLDACIAEEDCVCVTVTPTKTATAAPTKTATAAPTKEVTAGATKAPVTEAPIAEGTPATLPDTGIFDLPGIAAFGGGLILAIIGILLAL